MPNSARTACSAFAEATASLRHAFSQPVSRRRCDAFALTIHSLCSLSDATIRLCSATARGLVRGARALARKRAIHPAFRNDQARSQRSAGCWLVRYFGSALQSDGTLSGVIEPLLRIPALP